MTNVNWINVMRISTVAAAGLLAATLASQIGCGGDEPVVNPDNIEKPKPPVIVSITRLVPRQCPKPEDKVCPVCPTLVCELTEQEVCECEWTKKKCHTLGGSGGEEVCQFIKHGCKCEIVTEEVCHEG